MRFLAPMSVLGIAMALASPGPLRADKVVLVAGGGTGADGSAATQARLNTPFGVGTRLDGYEIRTAAVSRGVPCITTVQGLAAAVQGIEALARGEIGVLPLQEYVAHVQAGSATRSGAAREVR